MKWEKTAFSFSPLGRLCRLSPLRKNGPTGQRANRLNRFGQSMLEYSVLIAAVTAAMVIMADYVRKAFNAHAETIEEELNGATE